MGADTEARDRSDDAFVDGVHLGLALIMASLFAVASMVGVWLSRHPVASKAVHPTGVLIAITAGLLTVVCGYVAYRAWRSECRGDLATVS